MHPLLIIRSNLYSPDIVIYPNDHVKEKIEQILSQVQYPSSIYYIILEYIRTRLKDCTKKALRSEYNPDHCPIIFDSWTCWKSTPPDSVQVEQCPDFPNLGFKTHRFAEKLCTKEASWWVHPATNR